MEKDVILLAIMIPLAFIVVTAVGLLVVYKKISKDRKIRFNNEFLNQTTSSIGMWELRNDGDVPTPETEKADAERFVSYLKGGNQAFLENLMNDNNE